MNHITQALLEDNCPKWLPVNCLVQCSRSLHKFNSKLRFISCQNVVFSLGHLLFSEAEFSILAKYCMIAGSIKELFWTASLTSRSHTKKCGRVSSSVSLKIANSLSVCIQFGKQNHKGIVLLTSRFVCYMAKWFLI